MCSANCECCDKDQEETRMDMINSSTITALNALAGKISPTQHTQQLTVGKAAVVAVNGDQHLSELKQQQQQTTTDECIAR